VKDKRFTAEQIIEILREGESGEDTVLDVCRKYSISSVSYYRWRQRYHGMAVPEVRQLQQLIAENARLKRLLAERDLEVDALKRVLEKKA
jgi:putative transposase